ncbi:MAG TPA: YecA family protein [Crenotrichaceae bacterium]|nr:YecA family protein [Crenotrichaceae bacterium]
MNNSWLTYEDIEVLMQSADNFESPSEIHGMMTGFLCAKPDLPFTHWLSEIDFSFNQASDRELLEQLYHQIAEILVRNEYDFDLLLPDDDSPSDLRAIALSHWVQGFLYGLGYRGDEQDWPGETQSILLDLTKIGQLDPQVDTEEDEQALMEVTEYVRVSVLLIHAELNQVSSQQTIH